LRSVGAHGETDPSFGTTRTLVEENIGDFRIGSELPLTLEFAVSCAGATKLAHRTFFGDRLGYDDDGDDLLGVNRDPEQNCPICGIAGHNHTSKMTKECARKLLCGDDQTGKASELKPNSHF
jgi:hypothetical protein